LRDHALAALFRFGLELGLQRRKFGKRRVRVRRFLAALLMAVLMAVWAPLVARCVHRRPFAVAARAVETLILAAPPAVTLTPTRLVGFG
jgi:hypothetical protein